METFAPVVEMRIKGSVASTKLPLWKISVEQYHEMTDAGLFALDDDVELIHGYIVEKMAKNALHIQATRRLFYFLTQLIGLTSGWLLSIQDPIVFDDSEPEPDVAIIRGALAVYDHRKPAAADIGIAIEVSDSSLEYDQSVKKQLYANAGVPEYWIVNLPQNRIEVYREPMMNDSATYRIREIFGADDTLSLVLDGVDFGRIPTSQILPPTD